MRSFSVVVPVTMQYEILKAANASAFAGHKGARITLQWLKERFYWPSMGTDVEAFVAACKVCNESKNPPGINATREPLKPLAARRHPSLMRVFMLSCSRPGQLVRQDLNMCW